MKRREFLKTSIAASTLTGLTTASLSLASAQSGGGSREYYELRIYRLKPEAKTERLDSYLETAAIPAWNRLGIRPVGVFTERETKEAPALYVLIPYPSLESFSEAVAKMMSDPELQKAGTAYLQAPAKDPAFDRIESWLMLAFAGMPKIELPSYSRDRKPRMFELRTYPSYSEVKALKKVEMFNSGEMDVMREVGLAPVFYGQALIGSGLPQLTYMLSAPDQETHQKHWAAFGKHPVWNKLKDDPQYADTVINNGITHRFLVPTAYSQI
ncbi:MAG TPA: NIPSNAP family protein [Verrucomicrobiae bacterium]|nr:NIPSNAP family protein [Verrucomicrobiae bacterium]